MKSKITASVGVFLLLVANILPVSAKVENYHGVLVKSTNPAYTHELSGKNIHLKLGDKYNSMVDKEVDVKINRLPNGRFVVVDIQPKELSPVEENKKRLEYKEWHLRSITYKDTGKYIDSVKGHISFDGGKLFMKICNNTYIPYTIAADNKITFSKGGISTKMYCYQGDRTDTTIMDAEDTILSGKNLSFNIVGDILTLETDNVTSTWKLGSDSIAKLKKELESKEWSLQSFIYKHEESPKELVNGSVSFNNGNYNMSICNDFSGTYVVADNKQIKLAGLTRTEKSCDDKFINIEMFLSHDLYNFDIKDGVLTLENEDSISTWK